MQFEIRRGQSASVPTIFLSTIFLFKEMAGTAPARLCPPYS